MHITNYQMHNVLKVYTNHLSRDRFEKSGRPMIRKPNSDMVRISSGGKRQNLIDRVAADIVSRITQEGIGKSERQDAQPESLAEEPIGGHPVSQNRTARFEYNVLNGRAEKETNTLSVEDAGFLIQRIDELTGGTEGRETESSMSHPDGKKSETSSDGT